MHAVLEQSQLCAHPCSAVWVARHAATHYPDFTFAQTQQHPFLAPFVCTE